jgi:hypothetical protein
MRNKILLGTILSGFLAAGYAMTFDAPVANAGAGKNLKVYPKKTDKKAIKKDMKAISKALGVQCDFCHSMSAMDKDTDMKNKARDMMRMMNSANASMKKAGFKKVVTCKTCHNGAKEPKN